MIFRDEKLVVTQIEYTISRQIFYFDFDKDHAPAQPARNLAFNFIIAAGGWLILCLTEVGYRCKKNKEGG